MTPQQNELLNRVYKHFQTTMIGALARFEENFGYLWENNHREQEKFDNLWEDTRNSILNNGNKQARAALDDIGNFFTSSNSVKRKYHYKFYLDNNQNNENNNNHGDK